MESATKLSNESYRDLISSGDLNKMQSRVIEILQQFPSITGGELSDIGQNPHLYKRLIELQRLQVVRVDKVRPCTVSKKRARTWVLTGKKPVKNGLDKQLTAAKSTQNKTLDTLFLLLRGSQVVEGFSEEAKARKKAEATGLAFAKVKIVAREEPTPWGI